MNIMTSKGPTMTKRSMKEKRMQRESIPGDIAEFIEDFEGFESNHEQSKYERNQLLDKAPEIVRPDTLRSPDKWIVSRRYRNIYQELKQNQKFE
jgi:hypothetical protein